MSGTNSNTPMGRISELARQAIKLYGPDDYNPDKADLNLKEIIQITETYKRALANKRKREKYAREEKN